MVDLEESDSCIRLSLAARLYRPEYKDAGMISWLKGPIYDANHIGPH